MDKALAEGFRCPRWAELPSLPLYMDQVMLVLADAVGPFAVAGEKMVTSSMVNNYVKHGLVQPPEKKKYGKTQLSALILVSVLKRVLSLSEIAGLVQMLTEACGTEGAYDLFCEELERMLAAGFGGGKLTLAAASEQEPARAALNAALLALVGKLLLQSRLPPPEAGEGKG